jgi:hypothetical protein
LLIGADTAINKLKNRQIVAHNLQKIIDKEATQQEKGNGPKNATRTVRESLAIAYKVY